MCVSNTNKKNPHKKDANYAVNQHMYMFQYVVASPTSQKTPGIIRSTDHMPQSQASRVQPTNQPPQHKETREIFFFFSIQIQTGTSRPVENMK